MIIYRHDLDKILKLDKLLLYGRRKTGKTFYTKLKKKDWEYFIVKRGGLFLSEDGEEMDVKTFIKYASKSDKIIIDEFHRANESLFAALQGHIIDCDIILITSTLHFFKNESKYSLIFGLFPEYKVDLISPIDLLKKYTKKEEVEKCFIWQEPTQIGYNIETSIITSKNFVKSLVGEILEEEDILHTSRIECILQAIANGKNTLNEIVNYLYSQKTIQKQETGLITPYIDVMIKIGLIEKISVFKKSRKSYYRIKSPLIDFIYYLNGKYCYFDRDLPIEFLLKIWENKVGFYAEQFFEKLLSELYNLIPVKIFNPEIDIALTRFDKLEIVGEVKWKNKIKYEDIKKAEEKLRKVNAKRYLLIVPEEISINTWMEVITPEILRSEILKLFK